MITSISNTSNTSLSDDDIITRAISENNRLINLANEAIGKELTPEMLTDIDKKRDITSYMDAMNQLHELYMKLNGISPLTSEQQDQLDRINNELMPLVDKLQQLNKQLNGLIVS